MAPWVRRIFLYLMPRLLLMRRPLYGPRRQSFDPKTHLHDHVCTAGAEYMSGDTFRDPYADDSTPSAFKINGGCGAQSSDIFGCSSEEPQYSPEVQRALEGVQFIARHIKEEDKTNEAREEWKYAALVLDRLFLLLFLTSNIAGTALIFLRAPSLYDYSRPIDLDESTIGIYSPSPGEPEEIIQDWKYVAMVLDRLFLWLFTLACVLGAVAIIFQAPSLYDTRESIDTQFSNIKVPTSDPRYRG